MAILEHCFILGRDEGKTRRSTRRSFLSSLAKSVLVGLSGYNMRRRGVRIAYLSDMNNPMSLSTHLSLLPAGD
jgi:hypothetical protein